MADFLVITLDGADHGEAALTSLWAGRCYHHHPCPTARVST